MPVDTGSEQSREAIQKKVTFFLSFVGEHRSESSISNTFDTFDSGVKLVINDDATFVVDFDADLFEVETLCYWSSTDGNEDDIDVHGVFFTAFCTFELDGDLAIVLVGGDDFGVELEFDALFGEDLLKLFPGGLLAIENEDVCYDADAISSSKPAPPIAPKNSTTVTSDPNRLQTLPISRPITPPPMTTIFSGTFCNERAPVELTI
jgi:hypothetical protein